MTRRKNRLCRIRLNAERRRKPRDIRRWLHADKLEFRNRRGKLITADEWMRLIENDAYRIVKVTRIENGTIVSTIWTGTPSEGNTYFETWMRGGALDIQMRARTELLARIVHCTLARMAGARARRGT